MQDAEVLDRRTSPDGVLHFRVERYDDGRLAFGFEESDWHQHSDMFDARGRTPEQVAMAFADDLVSDRLVIVHGKGDDNYWVLDAIEQELEYYGAYALLEFRFWSGRGTDRAELLEGSVDYKPLSSV
jgi:hypothetical protein